MRSSLDKFEAIARALAQLPRQEPATQPAVPAPSLHPFEARNIHPSLQTKVRKLFDDGYFSEATFHAFKFLDKKINKISGIPKSGLKLMMDAFDGATPKVMLNTLATTSEQDEQQGYRFIFAGGMQGIRNPRGHEDEAFTDDPDICLDHLSFVSMLLRRLEQAGYK
jgi:uncharacterized protein (TIGR02391 family)